MVNYEVKIRNEFFISALFVENMITSYLSEKLYINDLINSKVFGDNENELNFSQKIDFLIDSDEFSIIDNSKLSVYHEIYNELLLNKNSSTFEECLTSTDNNDDFLLILYPQSEFLPREEKLTNACYQLIGEVSQLVSDFTNKQEIKLHSANNFLRVKNYINNNLSKVTLLFTLLFLK